MKKAIMSILTVWIMVCAGLLGIFIFIPEEQIEVSAKTIIVDDDGTPGVDCNYTTIQGGINAADPGDTVFVKNGTYYETVDVFKMINLTGEDRNTTIIDGGGSFTVVRIDTNWVNMSGFSVINGNYGIGLAGTSNNHIFYNNLSNTNYGGVFLHSSTNNTITNNNASYNGIGVYLLSSNSNTLVNNTMSSNTYYGLCVAESNGNIITNNTILSNDQVGIFLLGYNTTIVNNEMMGNGICIPYGGLPGWNSHTIDTTNTVNGKPVYYWKDQNSGTVPFGAGQVILANCTNVVVENQNVSDGSVGIELGHSSSNIIANNTASSNNWFGIYLYSSSNNSIDNNNASLNTEFGFFIRGSSDNNNIVNNTSSKNLISIRLLDSSSNTFINNEMVGDGVYISGILKHWNTHFIDTSNTVNGKPVYYWKNQTGGTVPPGAGQVILANCTNVVVENHNIRNGSIGIELGFSNSNTLANNTASSNNWCGIILYSSYSNTISNNNASTNIYGIYLDSSSNNNITYNNASENDYGIFLPYGESNTIAYNNVSSNKLYGIYIEESHLYDNIIYHNNIINNINQAYDNSGISEKWDNGYPYGGNYWSDYTGNDSFKGPNQNIPGSDGIGDIQYVIDFNSFDHYPLMKPFKPINNYIFLEQGWNLISIPLIQEEQNLTRVLGSIDSWYDTVEFYNITDKNDHWKINNTGKSFGNDLTNITEKMGFWIHITNPGETIFLYNGTQPPSNQTITLYPGWNMVGYPSPTSYNRTNGLNNLTFGMHVDSIWTYNAVSQRWDEIGPSDYFEVGKGYWIHAKTKCEWEVPL